MQIRIARRRKKIHHRRVETIWQHPSVVAQTEIIARSLKHWTGRDLLGARTACPPVEVAGPGTRGPAVRAPADLAEKVFHAPFVLVSHGIEADPVLNYGNAAALALWEMSWPELTRTPSRLTAEAPNREERARLLDAVTRRGFIDDYSGVRISKSGRRFRIAQATVWNLVSPDGKNCGQAAARFGNPHA